MRVAWKGMLICTLFALVAGTRNKDNKASNSRSKVHDLRKKESLSYRRHLIARHNLIKRPLYNIGGLNSTTLDAWKSHAVTFLHGDSHAVESDPLSARIVKGIIKKSSIAEAIFLQPTDFSRRRHRKGSIRDPIRGRIYKRRFLSPDRKKRRYEEFKHDREKEDDYGDEHDDDDDEPYDEDDRDVEYDRSDETDSDHEDDDDTDSHDENEPGAHSEQNSNYPSPVGRQRERFELDDMPMPESRETFQRHFSNSMSNTDNYARDFPPDASIATNGPIFANQPVAPVSAFFGDPNAGNPAMNSIFGDQKSAIPAFTSIVAERNLANAGENNDLRDATSALLPTGSIFADQFPAYPAANSFLRGPISANPAISGLFGDHNALEENSGMRYRTSNLWAPSRNQFFQDSPKLQSQLEELFLPSQIMDGLQPKIAESESPLPYNNFLAGELRKDALIKLISVLDEEATGNGDTYRKGYVDREGIHLSKDATRDEINAIQDSMTDFSQLLDKDTLVNFLGTETIKKIVGYEPGGKLSAPVRTPATSAVQSLQIDVEPASSSIAVSGSNARLPFSITVDPSSFSGASTYPVGEFFRRSMATLANETMNQSTAKQNTSLTTASTLLLLKEKHSDGEQKQHLNGTMPTGGNASIAEKGSEYYEQKLALLQKLSLASSVIADYLRVNRVNHTTNSTSSSSTTRDGNNFHSFSDESVPTSLDYTRFHPRISLKLLQAIHFFLQSEIAEYNVSLRNDSVQSRLLPFYYTETNTNSSRSTSNPRTLSLEAKETQEGRRQLLVKYIKTLEKIGEHVETRLKKLPRLRLTSQIISASDPLNKSERTTKLQNESMAEKHHTVSKGLVQVLEGDGSKTPYHLAEELSDSPGKINPEQLTHQTIDSNEALVRFAGNKSLTISQVESHRSLSLENLKSSTRHPSQQLRNEATEIQNAQFGRFSSYKPTMYKSQILKFNSTSHNVEEKSPVLEVQFIAITNRTSKDVKPAPQFSHVSSNALSANEAGMQNKNKSDILIQSIKQEVKGMGLYGKDSDEVHVKEERSEGRQKGALELKNVTHNPERGAIQKLTSPSAAVDTPVLRTNGNSSKNFFTDNSSEVSTSESTGQELALIVNGVNSSDLVRSHGTNSSLAAKTSQKYEIAEKSKAKPNSSLLVTQEQKAISDGLFTNLSNLTTQIDVAEFGSGLESTTDKTKAIHWFVDADAIDPAAPSQLPMYTTSPTLSDINEIAASNVILPLAATGNTFGTAPGDMLEDVETEQIATQAYPVYPEFTPESAIPPYSDKVNSDNFIPDISPSEGVTQLIPIGPLSHLLEGRLERETPYEDPSQFRHHMQEAVNQHGVDLSRFEQSTNLNNFYDSAAHQMIAPRDDTYRAVTGDWVYRHDLPNSVSTLTSWLDKSIHNLKYLDPKLVLPRLASKVPGVRPFEVLSNHRLSKPGILTNQRCLFDPVSKTMCSNLEKLPLLNPGHFQQTEDPTPDPVINRNLNSNSLQSFSGSQSSSDKQHYVGGSKQAALLASSRNDTSDASYSMKISRKKVASKSLRKTPIRTKQMVSLINPIYVVIVKPRGKRLQSLLSKQRSRNRQKAIANDNRQKSEYNSGFYHLEHVMGSVLNNLSKHEQRLRATKPRAKAGIHRMPKTLFRPLLPTATKAAAINIEARAQKENLTSVQSLGSRTPAHTEDEAKTLEQRLLKLKDLISSMNIPGGGRPLSENEQGPSHSLDKDHHLGHLLPKGGRSAPEGGVKDVFSRLPMSGSSKPLQTLLAEQKLSNRTKVENGEQRGANASFARKGPKQKHLQSARLKPQFSMGAPSRPDAQLSENSAPMLQEQWLRRRLVQSPIQIIQSSSFQPSDRTSLAYRTDEVDGSDSQGRKLAKPVKQYFKPSSSTQERDSDDKDASVFKVFVV